MSVLRYSFLLALLLGIAWIAVGRAQDDAGLDSLLSDLTSEVKDISSSEAVSSASAPEVSAAEVPAAAEAEVAELPAEAPAVVEPAVAEEAFEPAVVEETVAEAPVAEPVQEAAAVAEEPVALEPVLEPVAAAVAEEPEPAAEPVDQPLSDLLGEVEEATPAAAPLAEAAPEAEPEPVPVVEGVAAEEPVVEEAAAVPAEEVAGEAAAPVEGMPAGMDPKLFAQQEEVRRQMREAEGRKNLEDGLAALQAGKLDEAIQKLQDAQAKLPGRPSTAPLIEQARAALGSAHLRKATDAFARNDLKNARQSFNQARPFVVGEDKDDWDDLDRKLGKAEARAAELAARPIPVKKRPDVVEREKTIKELLNEGRQYLEIGDYNQAEVLFEKVLLRDEYNIDAMRFLRKLDEFRYKARTKEMEATRADMLQKVRDTWNPPVREEAQLPQAAQQRGVVETKTSAQKLQEKMEQIIIPSIEFRQANITDVVNFLVEASVSGDKLENTGVNIILNLSAPGGEAAPAPTAPAAEFGGDFGGGFGDEFGGAQAAPAAAAPTAGIPTITLNLRRISLLDAIKYITEVARLKFRLEENAVIITPEGVVSGRVITRMYPVQPSIIDVVVEKAEDTERTGEFVEMGSSRTSIKKSDVKDFFEKAGVPFPTGTSITYNPTISQLIVANTPENLEVFERILSRLNVIPNQVEIEARFVEIGQDDLEELGFQWILTDDWEIATKQGATLGGQQEIKMNADPSGITKGLRFFGETTAGIEPVLGGGYFGGIAQFASVLTNPELSVIIQALSMKGGSDLLSAPRVTTRSGVNAQIQVVREIIYPTTFDTQQPSDQTFNGGGTGETTVNALPPLIYPSEFETRATGVILNVTPTVGPDGYTIDLTLVPEVAELVDWIQYGYTLGNQMLANIPQPVFASRNVTTSMVIWDGQTVVMGGLINEQVVKYEDKIPILGDIPLLGRLFRSEGSYSQKKNLLIFVTARLVDPSGKPIHRGEAVGAGEATATPEAAAKP